MGRRNPTGKAETELSGSRARVVFRVRTNGVTNLLTLNLRRGGNVVVRGRFVKRYAALSAARGGGVRQGACVARCGDGARPGALAALDCRAAVCVRFPSRAFPAPSGVRTSSLHCSANSWQEAR